MKREKGRTGGRLWELEISRLTGPQWHYSETRLTADLPARLYANCGTLRTKIRNEHGDLAQLKRLYSY